MWIRNNWQLWTGSRLARYFNILGIYNPESISGIILKSYYRKVSYKPIAFEDQIAADKKIWDESKKEDVNRVNKEFSQYKVGDTVFFSYPHGYNSSSQSRLHDTDSCRATAIILDKLVKNISIKVKIIEACDENGIVIYDSNDTRVFDKKLNQYIIPKKHILRTIKKGDEYWSHYSDWDTQ